MAEAPRLSCILVELADGSLRAFDYPDEESAASTYRECRDEWNAGRSLVFYLRRRTRFSPPSEIHGGDEVAHIELTSRGDAEARGAELLDALIFG